MFAKDPQMEARDLMDNVPQTQESMDWLMDYALAILIMARGGIMEDPKEESNKM